MEYIFILVLVIAGWVIIQSRNEQKEREFNKLREEESKQKSQNFVDSILESEFSEVDGFSAKVSSLKFITDYYKATTGRSAVKHWASNTSEPYWYERDFLEWWESREFASLMFKIFDGCRLERESKGVYEFFRYMEIVTLPSLIPTGVAQEKFQTYYGSWENFPPAIAINESYRMYVLSSTRRDVKALGLARAFNWKDKEGNLYKVSHYYDAIDGFVISASSGAIDSSMLERNLADVKSYLDSDVFLHYQNGKALLHFGGYVDESKVLSNKITFDTGMLQSGKIFWGYTYGDNPVYIDFDEISHLLLVGQSGSGKSVFQNVFIASLLKNLDRIDCLYLADLKGGVEYFPYSPIEKTSVVCDIAELSEVVLEVDSIMRARLKEMKETGVRTYQGNFIFLMIDEFTQIKLNSSVLNKEDAKNLDNALKNLSTMGRAAKIRIVCGLQKCTTAEMDSGFKNNLQSVALMKVKDSVTVSNTLGDTEDLKTAGIQPTQFDKGRIALSLDSGEIQEVQCPFLSDEACRSIIAEYSNQ